jgi:Pyridoxamine 5'-phosphate oxidase
MGRTYDALPDEMAAFLARQPVFFVATAPSGSGGHVNLSPKGLGSLRVLSPTRLAYLDLTGSGNETSAHLLQNGRITLMACAFEGDPLILRVYGRGSVALPGSAEWDALRGLFPPQLGERQLVLVDVARVQTSCGHGVPLMDLRGPRSLLVRWAEKKGTEGLVAYRKEKNVASVDGLPTHLAVTPTESSS